MDPYEDYYYVGWLVVNGFYILIGSIIAYFYIYVIIGMAIAVVKWLLKIPKRLMAWHNMDIERSINERIDDYNKL